MLSSFSGGNMGAKPYTIEDMELIKDLYSKGFDTVQIALQINRSQSGVERFLKKIGLYVKRPYRHKIDASEDKNIIDMYLNQNLTTAEIAKAYSATDTAILGLLKRMGINTSNTEKYSAVKNLDAFKTIDTELKAYLLGFITADGNITVPTARQNSQIFQLEIQERDRVILEWLAELIGLPDQNIKRYKRSGKNHQATVKIAFHSNSFCNNLRLWGIVPRKSHIVQLPKIDKELLPHFVRGLIDGDGRVAKDNISLFGNESITNSIHGLWVEIGIDPEAIHRYKNTCHAVVVNRLEERVKLTKYLYSNANYFLERKAIKAPDVCENISKLRELSGTP